MATSAKRPAGPLAVVFDLDGVLLDSEQVWDGVRRDLVDRWGGRWLPEATRAMMGMSAPEWSAYVRSELHVDRPVDEIDAAVAEGVAASYENRLPLLPGAAEAVRSLAGTWPLALASSSNRTIIETVLDVMGVRDLFKAVVSSEEVAHGKPSPDVYLATSLRLGIAPAVCVAIEDSANGIRSATSAGMQVIAVPNAVYPPEADALALAAQVSRSLQDVSPRLVKEAWRA